MAQSSRAKWLSCVNAALEKKATDIVLLKLKGIVSYADYSVICSGRSDRQVQAIAQSIETEMGKRGHRPLGIEGKGEGKWVLMDYGDLVIHIFFEPVRNFYDLEGLWIDAPRQEITEESLVQPVRKRKRVRS